MPTPSPLTPRTPYSLGIALCALLAIVQIAWAGYSLGVGNQSIQIAFLQHAADPALFANDPMVQTTEPTYATWFFRLLAPLLKLSSLESLYLFLHILTTFFTLAAVYTLARTITNSHLSALLTAFVLTAGHHRALAGDTLYSTGFTHTYFALAPALLALALFYKRKTLPAFALAGLLLNIHALTALYTLAMLTTALLFTNSEKPTPQKNSPKKFSVLSVFSLAKKIVLPLAAAILCALPTLIPLLLTRQTYDATWLNLMHIRSADHSFASTWWAPGDPDIPRFVLLLALFTLSLSFPVRSRTMRISRLMTLSVLALFALGYIFTELYPSAFVIRLQPFRASRLLIILMLVHIVHAATQALRMLPKSHLLPLAPRILELLSGILVLGALAEPSLLPALPLALLVVLLVSLVTGRLSALQASLATAALLLSLYAHFKIQFPLPLLSPEIALLPSSSSRDPLLWSTLTLAAVLALAARYIDSKPLRLALPFACTLLAAIGFYQLFDRHLAHPHASPLLQAQTFIAQNTPKNALLLAPSTLPNSRIFARRSLVPNWRDGTQLYFSSAFAPIWWATLADTEPGILASPDGSRLLSRGQSLATLEDEPLIALAQKHKATHILLPTPKPSAPPRLLETLYSNPEYTVYLPKISAAALAASIPPGASSSQWPAAEKFYQTVVLQNIDRNRKALLSLQIVDDTGRPIQDLPVSITQTRHTFLFGSSLSFFEPNDVPSLGDQKPAPVSPQELQLFPQLFNASMIPFSGKWLYLEPEKGNRNFSDLDKYVDYAHKNNIALEFHYLAGLSPSFLRKNPAEHTKLYPDHARELLARYHDKIQFWQITNDKVLLRETPPLFREFREKYPHANLGISDCVRFFSNKTGPQRNNELLKGYDGLLYLKQQGITPDFFSIHGHYPVGCWTDPRDMYEVLDTFAKQGVKIHVSEMLLPLNTDITGSLRKGKWTEDLQSEFLERYLAVCFSHPAVELVNLWGLPPTGWGASSGLLDEKMEPRKTFTALQNLWQKKWHTALNTSLPLDGTLRTPAFHGQYLLTLTLPSGQKLTTPFTVPEEKSATLKFQLNQKSLQLTNISPPLPPKPPRPPFTQPTTTPATAPSTFPTPIPPSTTSQPKSKPQPQSQPKPLTTQPSTQPRF